MAIDPRGMSLRQFADATILSLNDAWSFGRLDDEKDWRGWARQFVSATPFATRNVPNPDQFSDWRTWAERAYPMLEDVT